MSQKTSVAHLTFTPNLQLDLKLDAWCKRYLGIMALLVLFVFFVVLTFAVSSAAASGQISKSGHERSASTV